MALMVEGAFQEEQEARAKYLRGRLSSTQLSTYYVGLARDVGPRAGRPTSRPPHARRRRRRMRSPSRRSSAASARRRASIGAPTSKRSSPTAARRSTGCVDPPRGRGRAQLDDRAHAARRGPACRTRVDCWRAPSSTTQAPRSSSPIRRGASRVESASCSSSTRRSTLGSVWAAPSMIGRAGRRRDLARSGVDLGRAFDDRHPVERAERSSADDARSIDG